MSTSASSSLVPFVGLRPFHSQDVDWFSGRDREISALTRKVHTRRFIAVVGPSGSGKSSLVRAGVVPLLDASGWQVVIARPGSAPIATLAAALTGAASQPEDRLVEACRFRFEATLRASAYGLAEVAERLAPDAPRLVLIVDQFEELFRYGQDARAAAGAAMREEGRAYVELLLAAAAREAGRLHIVLTMRSDYFGNCSAYQGLAEAVSAGQYLVPLPDRDQLETAIREPVAKAGAIIEDSLVQRLLVDVEEETDQLPLFQHTLRRLWEAAQGEPRTLQEADYVRVGRIAGSIDKKAEEIFSLLAKNHPSDAATLEWVMKALTDLDEHDRATRRPQKRSELLALLADASDGADAAETSLNRVLEALGAEDASFLQISNDADPDVDIGHEALIRSWRRLAGQRLDFKSGWLCEEREDGERWREFVRRASEGQLLSFRGQQYASQWLRRRPFGSAWTRRYGNAWKAVEDLRRRSRRATVNRAVASVVLVSLIASGAGLTYLVSLQEMPEAIDAKFAQIREMPAQTEKEKRDKDMAAEQAFNFVAVNLHKLSERSTWLRRRLIEEEEHIPQAYGVDPLPGECQPPSEPWPFVLKLSAQWEIDTCSFYRQWTLAAKYLTQNLGIPTPFFRIEESPDLSRDVVIIKSPDFEKRLILLDYEYHGLENRVLVNTDNISDESASLLERYKLADGSGSSWSQFPLNIPALEGQWQYMPRWFLPILVNRTSAVASKEFLPYFIAQELWYHPEPLLGPQVVHLLLDRLSKDYPETVAEARHARGELLSQDLAEFVKLHQPFANLPILLDALAQFPKQEPGEAEPLVAKLGPDSGRNARLPVAGEGSPAGEGTPAEVVRQATQAMDAEDGALPKRLHGPWAKSDEVPGGTLQELAKAEDPITAYFSRDFDPGVSLPRSPIIAYLGRDLVAKWRVGETGLAPELLDAIDTARDAILERTGVEVPGFFRFRSAIDWAIDIEPWQLQIETSQGSKTVPNVVAPDKAVDVFIRALSADAWNRGVGPPTAEYVSSLLQEVSPELRTWLTNKYSVTDLKLLLRGVLNPNGDGVPDGTIQHTEWLLGSLVFWTHATNGHDPSNLVARLRQTQSARLEGRATATSADPTNEIGEGVRALSEGRVKDAEDFFRKATENGEASAQSFLDLYPAGAAEVMRRALEQPCGSLDSVALERVEQLDLEGIIAIMPEATSGKRWRRPKLCLLASYGSELQEQRTSLLRSLLADVGSPEEWAPDEAAYLAQATIEEYDPLSTDPKSLALARQLLEGALKRLDEQQAVDAFLKVVGTCQSSEANKWCWDLLDSLARAAPKGDIPLEATYQLSSLEPRRYLEHALEHAERAEGNLSSSTLSDEDRTWKADVLAYSKAMAYNNLAALGDDQRWREAEKLLRTVLESPAVSSMAHAALISLLTDHDQFDPAMKLIAFARKRWPDEPLFLVYQLRLEIAQGKTEAIAATARTLAKQASDSDDAMFAASIGELLTQGRSSTARAVINKSKNDYAADYLALLLYGLENREYRQNALQVLQSRWNPDLQGRWPSRLSQGDTGVWREMLIGYYLGKVPREDLYAPLADEGRFEESPFWNLPLSRRGMLCEFYFYDALRARVEGDREGMIRGLHATVDNGYPPYYEYKMAKFLLEHDGVTSD